ncbi:hypothetical protein [Ferrimonas senticii]|uniref:hypothetical protein n=1 Tax=Ferrimonas senticii TaxID=394566 RepID=UPI00041BA3A3|nr:hypothetical protein [Ferrimonas senticii]
MQPTLSTKLQLHYYLQDDLHKMDALARNTCEAELLAIIQEVACILNAHIVIDSEAWKEGGLRDIWTLTNANAGILSVIIGVVSLIISNVPATDPELAQLQKEDLKLSILERKARLAKLDKEIKSKNITKETVNNIVEIVDNNHKIVTRKSNFYKKLNNTHRVTKIGVNGLDVEGKDAFDEVIVDRKEFERFILHSNSLPMIIENEAVIEIISPVLRTGKHKWKGIYNGESINFSMKDNDFKNDVLTKKFSFTHGAAIKCVLHIHRKLDEVGEVVITGYSVDTVIENGHEGTFLETTQGKNHRHLKSLIDSQQDMFSDYE